MIPLSRFSLARFILLFIPFLLTACWEKDDPTPKRETRDIYGSWILQYIELPQENGQVTRVDGQNIRLNLANISTYQQSNEPFAYDLTGTLPVNQYHGRYATTGSPIVPTEPQSLVLDVKVLVSTKVGGPEQQMQLEHLYLRALEEVSLATISKNSELVLTSRYQSAKLVFLPSELCSLPK
ncbi:META domain-containing protein [Sabulibacter ruber]|uniref:META domain-containing protein n=1 Tax=Sabulibacter ruber TaxID=2811901 RepID=UPI001A960A72|nr:META domain-containing protein [Sabulibacter ruber]